MDDKYDLNSIYNDFFGKGALATRSDDNKEVEVEESIEDLLKEIDNLYLDDKSKETLTKIINYIKDYHEKKETRYLNFNILITSDNKESTSKIIGLLNKVANKYKYTDGTKVLNESFYNFEMSSEIGTLYSASNGIISLYDVNILEKEETAYIEKFVFSFTEKLMDRKITIVSGNESDIKSFLVNSEVFESKYFKFRLNVIDPDPSLVYDEITSSISNFEISDEDKIKLLDYITATLSKRDTDYLTYRDNIINYITFNKAIPLLESEKTIDEIFEELNSLVGLESVKGRLHELVDLITLKNKTKEDLKINDINLHMVFLGNPGTGKTTVARMISGILYNLKYIRQNKLIEVQSKDLVAEYVGQTAPKTMDVVNKARGGILFVDEAYSLASKNDLNSYKAEAIATLIKAMEDYRDDLVVIFAGYSKEMEEFLDSNSGIMSRIGYTFTFDDYTNEELISIFNGLTKKAGFEVKEDAYPEIEKLIDKYRLEKNFGNARFIRTLYEKTILKHASNTKNVKDKKVLKTITSKDINY